MCGEGNLNLKPFGDVSEIIVESSHRTLGILRRGGGEGGDMASNRLELLEMTE